MVWALGKSGVPEAELVAARGAAALAALGFEDKAAVARGSGLPQLLAWLAPQFPSGVVAQWLAQARTRARLVFTSRSAPCPPLRPPQLRPP